MDMTVDAETAAALRRNIGDLNISLITDENKLKDLEKLLSQVAYDSNKFRHGLKSRRYTWANWNVTVGSLAEYFSKLSEMVGPDTPVVFATNSDTGCTIKYAHYGYAGYFDSVAVMDSIDPKEAVDTMNECASEAEEYYKLKEDQVNEVRNSALPAVYLTVYEELK